MNPSIRRILDIGSISDSLWIEAIAKQHPSVQISRIGTENANDLDIDLDVSTRPSSCDYLHMRGLLGRISNWPRLYAHCLRSLRPGGYIEQLEWSVHLRSIDGSLSRDRTLARWSQYAIQASAATGKTLEIAENMAGLMAEAGFVNVVEKRFKWPIGEWPVSTDAKEIGRTSLQHWEAGMEKWVESAYCDGLKVRWSVLKIVMWLSELTRRCSGSKRTFGTGSERRRRYWLVTNSMYTTKCKCDIDSTPRKMLITFRRVVYALKP